MKSRKFLHAKNVLYGVFAATAVVFMLFACSACSYSSSRVESSSLDYYDSGDGISNKLSYNSSADLAEIVKEQSSSDGSAGNASSVASNRKIIQYLTYVVQTTEFEELINKIDAKVSAVGAYIESSDISGNGIYESYSRAAKIVVRVPSDNVETFCTFIEGSATVVDSGVTTDDVTLTYVDIESRISSYETEKAALEKLLAEATTVSDIISIQDRLTSVIYNIESYESRLRTYDNLIDYTTVTISIDEVKHVVVEDESVWERIGDGLSDSLEGLAEGFVDFFVWFVSSLPVFVVLGLIIAGIVFLVKFFIRRSRRKRAANAAQSTYSTQSTSIPPQAPRP